MGKSLLRETLKRQSGEARVDDQQNVGRLEGRRTREQGRDGERRQLERLGGAHGVRSIGRHEVAYAVSRVSVPGDVDHDAGWGTVRGQGFTEPDDDLLQAGFRADLG